MRERGIAEVMEHETKLPENFVIAREKSTLLEFNKNMTRHHKFPQYLIE